MLSNKGKGSSVASILQNGRQRIHTTFPDGRELIEEFDAEQGHLLLRKSKDSKMSVLGGGGNAVWRVEVGEDSKGDEAAGIIRASSSAPFAVRKDTKTHFEWRIRNLQFEKSVYSVSVQENRIVVRTSNKKYFTRISVSDLEARGIPLEQERIAWDHAASTLVIRYSKPKALMEWENAQFKERAKMPNMLDPNAVHAAGKDGQPPDCKQQ